MHSKKNVQPSGIWSIYMIAFFSGLAYFGFRSVFLLYLTEELKIDPLESSNIFAAFISIHFVLQVITGWISDVYLGNQRSVVLGGLISSFGVLTIAFEPSSVVFFIGVGAFAFGTAMSYVNIVSLLGKLYQGRDIVRDAGFIYWKVFSNLALVMGVLLSYMFKDYFSWRSVFIITGLASLAVSWIGFLSQNAFGYHGITATVSSSLSKVASSTLVSFFNLLLCSCLILISAFLIWRNEWLGLLIPILAVMSLLMMLYLSILDNKVTEVLGLIVLFFFMVAYMALFYMGSALWMDIFTHNVDRSLPSFVGESFSNLFRNIQEVPIQVVKSINGFFVVLFGPFMALFWQYLARKKGTDNPFAKFSLGFSLTALAFAILISSRNHTTDGLISLWWIISGYAVYTLGELCVIPIAFSFLTRIAPKDYMSVFVGMWLVSGALGLLVSNQLTPLLPSIAASQDPMCSLKLYCESSGMLAWMAFACCLLCFFLIPLGKKIFSLNNPISKK